jgi:3-phosphoshikimate 1-carboxyvinyltransferase
MAHTLIISGSGPLRGQMCVPGDKSLSHRALILGALSEGESRFSGWLAAGDTLATLEAVRALRVRVEREEDKLTVWGGTLSGSAGSINCENAGTAMRLLAGLLVGQGFPSVLDGSEQLRSRPMRRITEPLQAMGADIRDYDGCAPLTIRPAKLHGMEHHLKVASAQVKSAILLAGLHAEGETTVIEPGPSRDHTERMLAAMGADIRVDGRRVMITGAQPPGSLRPLQMAIPGDISSAAFLMVAAAIVPGSDVQIANVGLNPTRTGMIDILKQMGMDIVVASHAEQGGEPAGTLLVKSCGLNAAQIGGDQVVRAIDELPIIAAAATQAEGETRITDAAELRVKEVDRISMVAQELRKLGAEIDELPDGMIINGPTQLKGGEVNSHGDHRLGMALAVAGLVADGETRVLNAGCIGDSFPGFAGVLGELGADIQQGQV